MPFVAHGRMIFMARVQLRQAWSCSDVVQFLSPLLKVPGGTSSPLIFNCMKLVNRSSPWRRKFAIFVWFVAACALDGLLSIDYTLTDAIEDFTYWTGLNWYSFVPMCEIPVGTWGNVGVVLLLLRCLFPAAAISSVACCLFLCSLLSVHISCALTIDFFVNLLMHFDLPDFAIIYSRDRSQIGLLTPSKFEWMSMFRRI